MNAHGFTSALAPELDASLAFTEKRGCCGNSRIWYLKQFDAYRAAHERAAFDRDTVEGWITERLTRSSRYRSWDVLHPRPRPLAAGPRTPRRPRRDRSGGRPRSCPPTPPC